MNNNQFDFKDLIAFGTFIIVLLTFVFTFGRYYFSMKKPPFEL